MLGDRTSVHGYEVVYFPANVRVSEVPAAESPESSP